MYDSHVTRINNSMSTLQGRTISESYKDLLQISNNNEGLDDQLRAVLDGEGDTSSLYVSTSSIQVSGTSIFNGNVGIGTTNPSEAFVIKGDDKRVFIASDDYNLFTVGRRSTGELDTAYLAMYDEGVKTASIDTAGDTFFNGGNVGIGTSSPAVNLEIKGERPAIRLNDDDPTGQSNFEIVNNGGKLGIYDNSNIGLGNIITLYGGTSATGTTDFGYVGIGTSTPDSKLEIIDPSNHLNLKVNDSVSQSVIKFSDTDGLGAAINYDHNTDKLHFITDGTATPSNGALNITSDGNVGIGTLSPNERLRVTAGSNLRIMGFEAPLNTTTNQLIARLMGETNGSNFTDSKISFDLVSKDGASYDPALTLESGGNVGIGTTSPDYKLDVRGFINAQADDLNTDAVINLAGSNNTNYSAISRIKSTSESNSNGSSSLTFSTRDSSNTINEKMRIDSTGNVGIGTASPESELHVHGDLTFAGSTPGNQGTRARILHTSGTAANGEDSKNDGGLILQSNDNGTYVNGLTIDHNGNVGIGTTTPGYGLHVEKSGNFADIVCKGVDMTGAGWSSYIASISDQSGALRDTLIGVYRPTTSVQHAGVIQLHQRNGGRNYTWYDDSSNLRTSSSSANIGSTGGTVVGTQTSDERLKNIESDFDYGLEQVMQLQPIAYTFKDDQDETRHLGFGAQTTQDIIPEAVYDTQECVDGYEVDPEDEHKQTPRSEHTKLAMKYVELVPVLTKAIQEQQSHIDTINTNNQSITTDNESLKADNVALKADVETLNTDNESLKADNVALKADVETLNTDNESLKAALEALTARVEALEA